MEILKKYIWGTVATLILIVFLIILQKYQDASQRSYHFESKLDEVQKETCYWLFQKLKVVKTNHSTAIEDQEIRYISFAKQQFKNDWKGGTGDLSVLEDAIGSWASNIINLEKQSFAVRQQIANCDKLAINR